MNNVPRLVKTRLRRNNKSLAGRLRGSYGQQIPEREASSRTTGEKAAAGERNFRRVSSAVCRAASSACSARRRAWATLQPNDRRARFLTTAATCTPCAARRTRRRRRRAASRGAGRRSSEAWPCRRPCPVASGRCSRTGRCRRPSRGVWGRRAAVCRVIRRSAAGTASRRPA